jgi:hypothetical protein
MILAGRWSLKKVTMTSWSKGIRPLQRTFSGSEDHKNMILLRIFMEISTGSAIAVY